MSRAEIAMTSTEEGKNGASTEGLMRLFVWTPVRASSGHS